MSIVDLEQLEKKIVALVEKYELAKMEIEDLNITNQELLLRENKLKQQIEDYKQNISSIVGKIDISIAPDVIEKSCHLQQLNEQHLSNI